MLSKHTYQVLLEISKYIGIPRKQKQISNAISKNNFAKVTGREKGVMESNSATRKGIVGDWKNYFDEDCISLFKEFNNGIWNKLLINLDYEDNDNW